MTTERFARLTEEGMTPEQKRVADTIAGGPRGSWQRGPFKALLRSPEIANRIQHVGEFVRFKSSIELRLNELAIILCARKWTAQYERYAHRKFALAAGLRPEIADAIAEGKRPDNLREDEAIVYDFAYQLLHTGQVSDAAYDAVKSKFGENGVIDLIGAVGYYTIVSFVLNVDRVLLPADATPLKPL
jgi:4-carboxymuconolactone decarboxylase